MTVLERMAGSSKPRPDSKFSFELKGPGFNGVAHLADPKRGT